MNALFGETLRRLRIDKGLSQQQLAKKMFVDRSTVTKGESGSRLPDVEVINRLARCLGVGTAALMDAAAQGSERPIVLVLDDEKIVLSGAMALLRAALPRAEVVGFTRPSQALAFARTSPVALAFLDIEMGRVSGLDVCRDLLTVCPRANVVYLTAYRDYSFDAWATGACGFLLKPLTLNAVREQLSRLRYPFPAGGMDL